MLTLENRIFELSATYLEFIISAQTMTPVEFSEEKMATFRKNTAFKTACFWINDYPVLQTNRYDEKEDKILFIVAK